MPDLLISLPHEHGPSSSNLAEIKCTGAGLTHYRSSWKSADVRADKLLNEYQSKAHNLEKAYNGVIDDQVGPLEQKLNRFGNFLCLVVGQMSDSLQDLQNLLKHLQNPGFLKFADQGVI